MRVRNEHREVFLNFVESNRDLLTNKCCSTEGKIKGNHLWQKVSEALNSLGYGEKSMHVWRRLMRDWKSKTKVKGDKLIKSGYRIGKSPNIVIPLSHCEKRLLKLMGHKALDSDDAQELKLETIPKLEEEEFIIETEEHASASPQVDSLQENFELSPSEVDELEQQNENASLLSLEKWLKNEMSQLKSEVSQLKSEMSQLKNEIKIEIREVLREELAIMVNSEVKKNIKTVIIHAANSIS